MVVIFEQNKPLVLEQLEAGEFDYVETVDEVFEMEFYQHIQAQEILQKLSQSYPTPRQKEEVPLLVYIASNLSLRLHGAHSFHAYPLVVRSGGMLNVLGPQAGRKTKHPDTGDATLICEGFNRKNHYDRETPCDQDYLRKLAKDTEAQALMDWFGRDVVQVLREEQVFDEEGIFVGDATYLFVPDNPNYEGSARMLFDEHNHPLSQAAYQKMSDEAKVRCQWRRCYKMVNLIHLHRNLDLVVTVAIQILPGNAHEGPVLYALVKRFVETVGKGVMKRLILDRGFVDGEAISTCKQEYDIDVLIPARKDLDIYADAWALFQQSEVSWADCPPPQIQTPKPPRPRPKAVVKREQKRQQKLQELEKQKNPRRLKKSWSKRKPRLSAGSEVGPRAKCPYPW